MGYDVSFHPISPEEMREWYFTPLTWIQKGQEEKVLAIAAQHGMEDFYAEKYLDTLRVGAGTAPDELFDKSHGFYIAVIQGFFRDYYYTREVALPSCWRRSRNMPGYHAVGTGGTNRLSQSGRKSDHRKLLPPVRTCLRNRSHNFSGTWMGVKGTGRPGGALERWTACGAEKGPCTAAELGAGLLEPPRWWNQTPSTPMRVPAIPGLYHCDRDGVYLYIDTVSGQLADAIGKVKVNISSWRHLN